MIKKNEPPDLASDILEGAAQIAKFMFGDVKQRRKIYNLSDDNRGADKLPCFRLGGIICARKSTLIAWIASSETVYK